MIVGFEIKKLFFDAAAVEARVDRAKRKYLSLAGLKIRQQARRSIKWGGAPGSRTKTGKRQKYKVSAPGQPPRYHTQSPAATPRNILFGYDEAADSVIVGPVGLGRPKTPSSQPTVVATLEKGGTITVALPIAPPKIKRPSTAAQRTSYGRLIREGRLPRPERPAKKRQTVTIAPRPFMSAALEKKRADVAKALANSV